MSLLTTISQIARQKGDKLSIAIETQGGGESPKLRLVITPRLGPAEASLSAQEVAYRSAMRLPLIVTGTAEECEEKLVQHITQYSQHIDEAGDALRRMAEARTKAEHTSAKADSKKGKGASKEAETSQPEPKQATTPESNDIGGVGAF